MAMSRFLATLVLLGPALVRCRQYAITDVYNADYCGEPSLLNRSDVRLVGQCLTRDGGYEFWTCAEGNMSNQRYNDARCTEPSTEEDSYDLKQQHQCLHELESGQHEYWYCAEPERGEFDIWFYMTPNCTGERTLVWAGGQHVCIAQWGENSILASEADGYQTFNGSNCSGPIFSTYPFYHCLPNDEGGSHMIHVHSDAPPTSAPTPAPTGPPGVQVGDTVEVRCYTASEWHAATVQQKGDVKLVVNYTRAGHHYSCIPVQWRLPTQAGGDCLVYGGIAKHETCCAASCGTCGGRHCQTRPGGRDACCTQQISRTCSSSVSAPCRLTAETPDTRRLLEADHNAEETPLLI